MHGCVHTYIQQLSNAWQTPAHCDDNAEAPWHASTEANAEVPATCAENPDSRAPTTSDPNCKPTAANRDSAWRSLVDRALGVILERVDRIEVTILDVGGGIEKIVGELRDLTRIINEDAAARTPATTRHDQAPRPYAATSSPTNWQQSLSQNNACDRVEVVATPDCTQKEPPSQQVKLPGAEASSPILVDLDNASLNDGDNNTSAELRTRTPDSHVKRVHSQPRLRVVPCSKRLLGVTAAASIEEGRGDASRSRHPWQPRYKDPPGYDNARDFGGYEEPHYRPPLLQPKTHGVGRRCNSSPCIN